MPPPPSIDIHLLRRTYTDLAERLGRPATAPEVAKELGTKLGRKINPNTVRGLVHRHGLDDLPRATAGNRYPMAYRLVERLGPLKAEHHKTHYWYIASAHERAQAGLLDPGNESAQAGARLVDDLTHFGDVLDYSQEQGLYTRPAWPWEAGDYLAQRERPEDWRERLVGALRATEGALGDGVQVTEEHRRLWAAELTKGLEELG